MIYAHYQKVALQFFRTRHQLTSCPNPVPRIHATTLWQTRNCAAYAVLLRDWAMPNLSTLSTNSVPSECDRCKGGKTFASDMHDSFCFSSWRQESELEPPSLMKFGYTSLTKPGPRFQNGQAS